MINPNSVKAHNEIQPKLQQAEQKVLRIFDLILTAMSREQIAEHTDMKLSGVCGRVNSLLTKGYLKVHHKAKSNTSGKTVDFLIPTDAGERWLEENYVEEQAAKAT